LFEEQPKASLFFASIHFFAAFDFFYLCKIPLLFMQIGVDKEVVATEARTLPLIQIFEKFLALFLLESRTSQIHPNFNSSKNI
jgi:hypothetical protein